MPSRLRRTEFVADGCQRAWAAMEEEVRGEVQEEFAERWSASGFVGRWFLLRKINREVRRRLAELVPPESLF